MGSPALGVLAATHRNYDERQGRVILTQLDKNMENLIVITQLVRVFEVEATIADALRELGVPA